MPNVRALFDVVVYRTEAGDTTSFVKGEVADVPADQLDRLLDLDAVEKVSAKDAKAAGDGKTDQDAAK